MSPPPESDLFSWHPEYSIGHEEIDAQHQKLFALFGELNQGLQNGIGKQKMAAILKELAAYAQYHFATEEAAMASGGFALAREHVEQHQWFRLEIAQFVVGYRDGSLLSSNVAKFLAEWLKTHILQMDRQIGTWLASKAKK